MQHLLKQKARDPDLCMLDYDILLNNIDMLEMLRHIAIKFVVWTDRQTNRQTKIQTDKQIERKTDRRTGMAISTRLLIKNI